MYKKLLLIVNLILFLGYGVYAIMHKEKTLKDGQLVLFKLAPVDPRSLMQGDYMTLNYELSELETKNRIGLVDVSLDSNNVATSLGKKSAKSIIIKYHSLGYSRIQFGAESYFFQEGTVGKYENAKYGGLRIDESGNSVLIGLFDEKRNLIQ